MQHITQTFINLNHSRVTEVILKEVYKMPLRRGSPEYETFKKGKKAKAQTGEAGLKTGRGGATRHQYVHKR